MKTDANHDSCRNCRFSPGKPFRANRATCWSFDDILVDSGGNEWKNILNERNHEQHTHQLLLYMDFLGDKLRNSCTLVSNNQGYLKMITLSCQEMANKTSWLQPSQTMLMNKNVPLSENFHFNHLYSFHHHPFQVPVPYSA